MSFAHAAVTDTHGPKFSARKCSSLEAGDETLVFTTKLHSQPHVHDPK